MVNHEFRLFQVGNVIISPDVVTVRAWPTPIVKATW